ASPPVKRARRAKNADAPSVEKRGGRYRSKCPVAIQERYERVLSQRFYMVERRREGNALKEEFNVLGSTGNIYTVVINHTPRCDCPDASKGNHCKHIIFVFIKVLQVPRLSSHWFQKALLSSELEEIFTSAPVAPNAVTNARVQAAYSRAMGKDGKLAYPGSSSKSAPSALQNKRMPGVDDDCPICYESMHEEQEKNLVWCAECKNMLHAACFAQCHCTRQHQDLSCVYCRAKWIVQTSTHATPVGTTKEGYINIAAAAGIDPVRDESICEH
ncbi:hypothetical protein FISHEDRAFT_12462, partial [Fistulina hepatica ATCC 64428]